MLRLVPQRQRARFAVLLSLMLAGCVPRAVSPPTHPAASLPLPPTLRDAMVAVHARARARVGLPPLVWSGRLTADAQGWADTLARTGGFRHADQADEGENLWMGTRGAYRYAEMAGYWVGEGRNFTGPAHPFVSRTGDWHDVGHYTQIVWGATRLIGCALARNRRDDILVCRYWPAGNVEGEAAY
jgi:uncharacterized protein YkwD